MRFPWPSTTPHRVVPIPDRADRIRFRQIGRGSGGSRDGRCSQSPSDRAAAGRAAAKAIHVVVAHEPLDVYEHELVWRLIVSREVLNDHYRETPHCAIPVRRRYGRPQPLRAGRGPLASMGVCSRMRHPRLYRHADCDGFPPDRDYCVIYHRIPSVYRTDRLYLYIAMRR